MYCKPKPNSANISKRQMDWLLDWFKDSASLFHMSNTMSLCKRYQTGLVELVKQPHTVFMFCGINHIRTYMCIKWNLWKFGHYLLCDLGEKKKRKTMLDFQQENTLFLILVFTTNINWCVLFVVRCSFLKYNFISEVIFDIKIVLV